jgi:hypothetical protein
MPNIQEMEKVHVLANYIRQLWVDEYRDFELRTTGSATGWGSYRMTKWDGGTNSTGKHYESTWNRIATFCLTNDFQPERLVSAMFFNAKYPPQPNQAHGPFAVTKYRVYKEPTTRQAIRTSIHNDFEAQKSFIAANLHSLCKYGGKSEDIAIREIALTSTNTLSQLCRYCVLKSRNRPIAEKYADVAFREYRRFPDLYDEIWGDWIPQELRNRLGTTKVQ